MRKEMVIVSSSHEEREDEDDFLRFFSTAATEWRAETVWQQRDKHRQRLERDEEAGAANRETSALLS